MSIVNVFRKEALRNQYKSSEIGRSLIKQPRIINQSILLLITILLFSLFTLTTLTFSTTKSIKIKVSPENYTPIIYNEVIIINKHYAIDGENVKKNQAILSISKLSSNSELKKDIIRSPSDGVFFHSNIENNITKPFEPLGYLLNSSSENELSFWVYSNKNNKIMVNDKIKLIVNREEINGIITMIVGSKSNIKEQKIHIKLEGNSFAHLSPTADIEILLTQQSEKVINLIDY